MHTALKENLREIALASAVSFGPPDKLQAPSEESVPGQGEGLRRDHSGLQEE
jgi:hypothetical protein